MDGMGMELFQQQTDIKFNKHIVRSIGFPTIVINRE